MAFLNIFMLIGAAAVAVPIIIHILNRRSSRRVMWGAMRFLLEALVNRRRKILLEEFLLLCLRCLLIILVVLVAARPFIAPGSQVSWLVVLPLLLLSVAAFAATFVLWHYRRLRRYILAFAVLLLLISATAMFFEERLQARIFDTRGSRDIAIIIDASDSMGLGSEGISNFQLALEETEHLMRAAPPGSAFSLIVGGSRPYSPIFIPVSDRDTLLATIQRLEPGRGLMRAPDALALAAYTLAQGNNLAKQIIVITDGQRRGWSLADGGDRWQAVRESLEMLPSTPPVIIRRLKMPDSIRNAAITDIAFSRETIGLDREVRIQVTVANHGTEAITPAGIRLDVEDDSYYEEDIGLIPSGSTRTVDFGHRFQSIGAHAVEAQLVVEDDLPFDNRSWRVVTPLSQLQVLIVDGRPASRFFDRASAFASLALAPGAQAMGDGGGQDVPEEQWLLRPRVIDGPDFASLDFSLARSFLDQYAAVILADVPRLRGPAAEALAQYVEDGGALLVAHGQQSRADFYNAWRLNDKPVLPWQIGEQVFPTANEEQDRIGPAPGSFSHPAIATFRDDHLDLPRVFMRSYWRLQPGEDHTRGRVGARLNNGDPLLVDHSFGSGRVLQFACSLDTRDSNLPSSRAFVMMLHKMVYDMAGSGALHLNMPLRPGASLSLSSLAASIDRQKSDLVEGLEEDIGAIPPDLSAGLHFLALPDRLRSRFWQLLQDDDKLPYALHREGNEGPYHTLNEADRRRLRQYMLWHEALSTEQLLSAMDGARYGHEIWRPLALAAFFLLLAEIALSRWIARRRRIGSKMKVDFQERNQPRESFRRHLETMKTGGKNADG